MADDDYRVLPPVEREKSNLKRWGVRDDFGGRRPCPACGYDLRGTARATCPECGAKIDDNRIRLVAERRNVDWSDLLVFRWMVYGLWPMIAWIGVACVANWWLPPLCLTILILLSLPLSLIAGVWAGRHAAEEATLGSSMFIGLTVGVSATLMNLSLVGFVVQLIR